MGGEYLILYGTLCRGGSVKRRSNKYNYIYFALGKFLLISVLFILSWLIDNYFSFAPCIKDINIIKYILRRYTH